MKGLRLAEDLVLPLDAITQTFGILAVRGAGKSNLAAVMAEAMFANELPFVVVDPVGAWWGLRSAGDGRGPGLALPIFGGLHGDVPLERAGGAYLADLVVAQRLSCVLDVSEFSEGDKVRFLTDFAERLYRTNREPLHLFLEEADDYAPQKPMPDQKRLLGAWQNIVRRGRARGLGITMITQRSAVLNKDLLTQIETLFVLRTTSPQDRKAIAGWVEFHGESRELLASLPGLKDGEAWAWSPSWLRITRRVAVLRRWTFDSGATPKDLKGRRAPATLASVDLEAIKVQMAATIERAKAEDPRELQRALAAARAELKALRAAPLPPPKPAPAPLRAEHLKRLEAAAAKCERLATVCGNVRDATLQALAALAAALHQVQAVGVRGKETPGETPAANAGRARAAIPSPGPAAPLRLVAVPRQSGKSHLAAEVLRGLGARGLAPARERLLAALILRGPLSRAHLGVYALMSSSGGTFKTYVPQLIAEGLVGASGQLLEVTEGGRSAGDPLRVPAEAADLREAWRAQLAGGAMQRIFDALVAAYVGSVPGDEWRTRQQIGADAGCEATGGTFKTYFPKLIRLGLVEVQGGRVRLSPLLFKEDA